MHEKVLDVGDMARCQRRSPTNMLYGTNVWYPPVGNTHSNKSSFKGYIYLSKVLFEWVWSTGRYHTLVVHHVCVASFLISGNVSDIQDFFLCI